MHQSMRDAHQYVNAPGKRKPCLGSPRAGLQAARIQDVGIQHQPLTCRRAASAGA